MAPLRARQFYSLAPPQTAAQEPHPIPVPVTTGISGKVFLQLFTGTISIFVLAVLFWKMGKFFRHWTRDRVFSEDRKTTTRYARTWYGWVPLSTHEKNKNLFKTCYEKLRECTAWKSSRADYSWVWWDPGSEGLKKHYEDQTLLRRWLPRWLRSYEYAGADAIWNPGPPLGHKEAYVAAAAADDNPTVTATLASHDGLAQTGNPPHTSPSSLHPRADRSSIQRSKIPVVSPPFTVHLHLHDKLARGSSALQSRSLTLGSHPPSRQVPMFWSFKPASRPKKRLLPTFTDYDATLRTAVSTPLTPTWDPDRRVSRRRFDSSLRASLDAVQEALPHIFDATRSRKYQAWGARMQIKTCKAIRRHPVRLAGPPGSPISDLLASFASDKSSSLRGMPNLRQDLSKQPSPGPSDWVAKGEKHGNVTTSSKCRERDTVMPWDWVAERDLWYRSLPLHSTKRKHHEAWKFQSVREMTCSQFDGPSQPNRRHIQKHSHGSYGTSGQIALRRSIRLDHLNDWEIRLIRNLDRRLDWLLNEMEPGRKSFNFALLANHWLNPATWVVCDPPCRVPQDYRRRWGDPRYNVPYPEPPADPRPKYSTPCQKRAQTPRIDSWRAAVNQHRRASGARHVLKAVDLFEGSAEEPPDGQVDPACWILPKPPQGFEMSNKQKNAYYEGGAGWQEKLDDWRNVRHGYRIRKGIYEGKVNRTRVKEVVVSIGERYRFASSKFSAPR